MKSLVEAEEIKESQNAVTGSKRADASLSSSERYKKNLRETLENQKRKMLRGITIVQGKAGKGI